MKAKFEELLGKELVKCETSDYDGVSFLTKDGEEFILMHVQDCCGSVYLDDVSGDIQDLIGSRITLAEEVSNEDFEENFRKSFNKIDEWGEKVNSYGHTMPDSYTWTFYKIGTVKGVVVFRFYGTSNGYYSESVDFFKKENGVFCDWCQKDNIVLPNLVLTPVQKKEDI